MISVIVPIYNVEKYLSKCIESILSQTYKDLEIILVNDGSIDNSGKVCEEYKKKDRRIKVIHKENGGLSDARNVGIEISKGEYIAFIDSDDWIDEEYIEVLYKLLIENNADISICSFTKVYNEDVVNIRGLTKEYKESICSGLESLKNLNTDKHTEYIVAWNKLYRRNMFKDLRFPKGKIHEDEFLVPILLHRANSIVYTSRKLVYYRQRNDSITGVGFTLKKLDYLEALENRINYYKSKKINDMCMREMTLLGYTVMSYYKFSDNLNAQESFMCKEKLKSIMRNVIKDYKIRKYDKFKMILFYVKPRLYLAINDRIKR